MAGGISVHVVDVTRGLPAAGMAVEIWCLSSGPDPVCVAHGSLSSKGTLDHPIVGGEGVIQGRYRVVFHVGDFYRQLAYVLPEIPFLEAVPFEFGLDQIAQHYHLPLKVSPWGFSLFRGGE